MRVLVTGASGFIGGWVTRKFQEEGHTVFGLDKDVGPPNLNNHYVCNILHKEDLFGVFEKSSPEIVIHLAARTDLSGSVLVDYKTNTKGVKNIAEVCNRTPSVRRVIYTSSQLVCPLGYVPDDYTDYCPDTVYGKSKVKTEKIAQRCSENFSFCIVRPTTVWGPKMKPHYRRMIKYIDNGLYFHVGYEDRKKSYSYVKNISYQFYKLASAKRNRIHKESFYLADYEPISLRKYANAYQKELDARPIPTLPIPVAWCLAKAGDLIESTIYSKFPFTTFRLNNILSEYLYDLSDTYEVCGEVPYSMMGGARETVKWYKSLNGS